LAAVRIQAKVLTSSFERGRGLVLALFGGIIGVAGAFAETRFLRNLLFGIAPVDPVAFIASVAGVLLVIVLASYLPARRAMAVDPMIVLRHE
jgi:putative ABC transport system permease protein